jgi:hypothetical protein
MSTVSAEHEARARALDYLRTNGTLAPAATVHERVAAAFAALDAFLAGVTPEQARRPGPAGEWNIQEIVDHLVETHRAGLDELRCLLAGQRPPGDPIPAGLRSKACRLRPWPWLLDELRRIHGEILAVLAAAPGDAGTATAPLVMVVNVPADGGGMAPVHWVEECDWKAYAIVWRLHVLDHLQQARRLLRATPSARASRPAD